MLNQKDVFEGVSLPEIRKLNRLRLQIEVYIKKQKSKEDDEAPNQAEEQDTNGGNEEDENFNWQVQFEDYTQKSSPERLLDHCQQM